jgi:hypothetical protein
MIVSDGELLLVELAYKLAVPKVLELNRRLACLHNSIEIASKHLVVFPTSVAPQHCEHLMVLFKQPQSVSLQVALL